MGKPVFKQSFQKRPFLLSGYYLMASLKNFHVTVKSWADYTVFHLLWFMLMTFQNLIIKIWENATTFTKIFI